MPFRGGSSTLLVPRSGAGLGARAAILLALPLAVGMHAFGCFSSSSPATPTGTGGSGGSIPSGTPDAGAGGAGGAGGACPGCGNICAGVNCPTGSFCNAEGKCVTVPSCDAGTDCTQCTDYSSCASCYATMYAAGWAAYTALHDCVTCTACYGSCSGVTAPGFAGGDLCSSPPSSVDPCDGDGGCPACSACAVDGGASCGVASMQCSKSPECLMLMQVVEACPQPADGG